MKFYKLLALTIIAILALNSCKALKPKWVDTRNVPTDARERARKNVEEGRGISLKGLATGRGKTTYQFSTSNPMWRASLETLDFLPLTTVDYSGGIIITDWFADENAKNEYIKITVRFLSNEIRADGLNVIIHKKTCDKQNACNVSKIKSSLSQEIKLAILKEAAILKENEFVKDKRFKYPLKREGQD